MLTTEHKGCWSVCTAAVIGLLSATSNCFGCCCAVSRNHTDCTVPHFLCICAPLDGVSAGVATGPKLLCLLLVSQQQWLEINYQRIQGNNYHNGVISTEYTGCMLPTYNNVPGFICFYSQISSVFNNIWADILWSYGQGETFVITQSGFTYTIWQLVVFLVLL